MTFIQCSKTISNSKEPAYLSIQEIQKLPIHFLISLEIRFVLLTVHSSLISENPAVKTVLCVLSGYVTTPFQKEIQESVSAKIHVRLLLTENVLTPIPTRISGIVPAFREILNTGTTYTNTEYSSKDLPLLNYLIIHSLIVYPLAYPEFTVFFREVLLKV